MENKKANFIRISENRTNKIVTLLRQLTNLTNTSFYEYEDEDIIKIFNEIELEVENAKSILLKNTDKKNKNRRIVL